MFISILSMLHKLKGKKLMNKLCLKFVTQTRLLDRLIGHIRLLKRPDQAYNKVFYR